MKYFTNFILVFLCVVFLIPQENIVEKVDVDWWVVPLFAVDKKGESVNHLTANDIELFVNKKKISNFILYKRPFNVSEEELKREKITVIKKEKVVFLIFDIAYTTKSNMDRSKEIAGDLIKKSDSSTKFVLMILDPFAGLQYKYGPTNKKEVLNELIEKEVTMLPRSRNPFLVIGIAGSAQIRGKRANKYSGSDMRFFAEEIATGLKNTDGNFFFSFEALYYALNQIRDNKFVYLFSEGLTYFARKSVRHVEGEYFKNLKKSAEYLGKSGAVIFVIDTTGFGDDDIALRSGEDSLKYLAQESGGQYLRGDQKSLSNKLEKMNRAYYELAFSDSKLFKGKIRRIEVRPKSGDVKIFSLRTMEKRKDYDEMGVIEKELLAINLVDKNIYFKSPLIVKSLKVKKLKIMADKKIMTINIPGKFKEKKLDVFKLWVNEDISIDTVVKKSSILITDNTIKTDIKKINGVFGQVVIIDEVENTAYVQQANDKENEHIVYLKKFRKKFESKRSLMSEAEIARLDQILAGAAEYSKKLKDSVFHYFCKEEIVEILSETNLIRERTESKYDYKTGRMTSKRVPGVFGNVLFNKKKRLVNDYQLLQNGDKVVEQRKPIGKNVKETSEPGLQLESFISRRIVLTPVSILSWMNQGNFDFRIAGIQKYRGVEVAIIEVFPKNLSVARSIFGKVFIDLKDYSVLRMEINPGSIGRFEELIDLSKRLGSALELMCSIDFDKKRDGVRFPTMVKIVEKYIGGNYLTHVLKRSVWQRSRVTYKYTDYKFFDVDTEVKIKN
ncbi:MAG: hypothetical protein KAS21_08735 [Candidatus Aminicenantes bacterium]|nr:hypothetical protein [Candidatus Aminicenantes bacterium]